MLWNIGQQASRKSCSSIYKDLRICNLKDKLHLTLTTNIHINTRSGSMITFDNFSQSFHHWIWKNKDNPFQL